jgi:hypothetical protein
VNCSMGQIEQLDLRRLTIDVDGTVIRTGGVSGSGNYRSPSCSSSDRPVASQNEVYTALISAVVRGSSSVAFEPIWFIT